MVEHIVKETVIKSMKDRIRLTKEEIVKLNKKHEEEITQQILIIEECEEIIKQMRK